MSSTNHDRLAQGAVVLDDAIRRAAAEASSQEAASAARKAAWATRLAVAVPKTLALLAEGRDRLRSAGVPPIYVVTFKNESWLRSAHYVKHAVIWKVSKVAITADNQIYEVSTPSKMIAAERGLAAGDQYARLGDRSSTILAGFAAPVELKEKLSSQEQGSGPFYVAADGSITILTSYEPETYIPLEDVIAAQIVAATRR